MQHPSDGTLRHLCDEPLAPALWAHVLSCRRRQQRQAAIAADAQVTAALPTGNATPMRASRPALALARRRWRLAAAGRERLAHRGRVRVTPRPEA